ncbi:MAG: hypothetical protein GF416_04100 [Candidatus Altiarchaeales archaeon]|nr:hypothetical protein [Candidatus Altiarchaeales archaeon]MBD3416302.1 hypothetical protein [Candidatus Altiarchaeales archaeon]
MVPITRDNSKCIHRNEDRCTNNKIANTPVVNDSLQSQWYCSNCPYFQTDLD